ncbi:MAG: glycosyltransferase [Patescibacteria group bacterium]
MKILEINKFYHPWLGGVEKVVQDIAEGLNGQNELTVSVLACQTRNKRKIEEINGIKIYRAGTIGKLFGMPLSIDFFRLLKSIRSDYDAILIHHPFPLAFLARSLGRDQKLFIWYHSDIIRQKLSKWLFLPFIKAGLKRADRILVGSQKLADSSPLLQKHETKCEVINFGVDLDYFTADTNIKQAAIKIKQTNDQPLILSVGRLVPYKGFKYLISALAENIPIKDGLAARIQAKLIIIGAGPEEKRLTALIKKLNLEDQVTIIKPVPDLRPFYEACDLFVLPSISANEAFGLVQIEAMAYGKPIINTSLATGVNEVSPHNVSGLSVPPRNPRALAQAIARILSDPELKNSLGSNARSRVVDIFNQKNFIKKLTKLLSIRLSNVLKPLEKSDHERNR